jgi:bifunctional NMN adenylyltransferase/nudix hydrolase
MYDLLAYIGRFQPFHNGHKAVIDHALTLAHRVAVVIGSHDKPRSPKNPWTTDERIAMIRAAYKGDERISFVPVWDYTYNLDHWLTAVQMSVISTAFRVWKADSYKIGLIGFDKDFSSFYLHHFPQWENVRYEPETLINATDIRDAYFGIGTLPTPDIAPEETIGWLEDFRNKQEYQYLRAELSFIKGYKKLWKDAPFPPIFHTADTVVVQSGHILMVNRGVSPGRGLIALPGGFIGEHETVQDAALRELKEETGIDVPYAVLKGSIVKSQMFDDPDRSQRGRTITTAYLIRLNEKKLPKIKAGDDAAKAFWISLANLHRRNVFEDHYDIIHTLV